MAAERNNLSRRAVLGAAFAAPAILGGTANAGSTRPAHGRRWELALAAVRQAEATVETYRTDHMHQADHAYHAIRARWPLGYDFSADAEALVALTAALTAHEPFEERLNDLESAKLVAIKRLLRTPAPDLLALATKIALAVDHEVATLDGGEQCLAVLKADAWRLASAAN